MSKCYLFFNDGYFAGESEAYGRLPGNATTLPPPPGPWLKKWPRLVNGDWVMEEDHRERSKEIYGENAQEATEYWLAEDDWQSQPRKMTKPGPLPEGALLERPERPAAEELAQAKSAKLAEIGQAYDAAMTASLTMPKADPSASDIAIAAALFAMEDAEGLEFVASQHSEKKAALASQVENAQSPEEVAGITVSYAV